MGTLRGGNGGNRPPGNDGPPDGVPDLPPEWGVIVIPDDPAELAAEAAKVRRAFRRQARRTRWRRRLHLPDRSEARADEESPALAIPLLIMCIAVIATVTSLFAVAWPTQPRPPGLGPGTASSAAGGSANAPAGGQSGHQPTTGTPRQSEADQVPAVADATLADPAGNPVRVRDLAPAVLLFVDGCDCTALLNDAVSAAAQADPTISVVAVTASASTVVAVRSGLRVRRLVDSGRVLRGALFGSTAGPGTAGAGAAAAVLIGTDASVARVLPAVASVDDIRPALTGLHG